MLARLDEGLLGPDDTGRVVVTGGPGMGKSAILSTWLDRREAAGAAVPHHCVRRQVIDWDQPERIAGSLAAQIEAMFPEQRDARARPEGRLPELLRRASKQLGASGRLVLVVDGLDETRAEPGENPLPRFLPHVVPAGIRILCATRPTYPHLGWIEARSPARRVNLDDTQWASSNQAVVRGFWEAAEPDYQPPLPASTMAAAIGFYGGLGERESIAAAYAQGCAAIRLQGLADHDRPRLAVRAGVDAGKLVLAADPPDRADGRDG